MCGIVYVKNLKDSKSVGVAVECLYNAQKDRGQNGFGFVGLNKKELDFQHYTQEEDCFKRIAKMQYDEVLFHHRFPTSTVNRIEACHPFKIEMDKSKYYFIHNGVVSNSKELRAEHLSLDKKYISDNGTDFNDSEALAFDFIRTLTNRQSKMRAKGSITFVCLETDLKNNAKNLYFYSDGYNDLKMVKNDRVFSLTSEGDGKAINKNKLFCFDYKTRTINKNKWKTAGDFYSQYDNCGGYSKNHYKGGYQTSFTSYTKKEIGFKDNYDNQYSFWADDDLMSLRFEYENEIDVLRHYGGSSLDKNSLTEDLREVEAELRFRGLL